MKLVSLLSLVFAASSALYAGDLPPGVRENAVWAGSIFLRGSDPATHEVLTNKKLSDLADRLKHNRIRYLYVFAGPYQEDGHLPRYAFSDRARDSVAFLKQADPSMKILPWIGGIEGKTVHLEKNSWLETSVQETAKLLASVPFDGVHIDLEYVLFPKRNAHAATIDRYDSAWVGFHKKLRERLPKALLSTVVVSSAPGTHPWKHKHAMKDLTSVSRTVDQVVFMYYETRLHDAASYRENMRLQLRQIQQMKSELGAETPKYLLGIGTFKNEEPLRAFRDMKLENVSHTLTTLNQLMNELSPDCPIDGLAIYSDWTTTPSDWDEIRKYLLPP